MRGRLGSNEVIMGRDENLEVIAFRCIEQSFDILNSLVLGDTISNQLPRGTRFAQEIVLWVRDQDCRVIFIDVHVIPPFCFGGFWILMFRLRV